VRRPLRDLQFIARGEALTPEQRLEGRAPCRPVRTDAHLQRLLDQQHGR
jgi:hypothetical protein